MIWVNALWIATLLQQWAREYVETPKSSIELKHSARVRSLFFRGAKLYQISLLVEILPTLIHVSVYLFFGGLMITGNLSYNQHKCGHRRRCFRRTFRVGVCCVDHPPLH